MLSVVSAPAGVVVSAGASASEKTAAPIRRRSGTRRDIGASLRCSSGLRALVEERLQGRDRLLVAVEVARDLLVEVRRAGIELVPGWILADEVRDLVHLGDPAIGLRRHDRQRALQPS